MNNKAIVTLIIGNLYKERWHKLCSFNWNKYAKKNGYDIVLIEDFLDQSDYARSKSPAWQKCLILGDEEVKQYDRVVWIDSDILLNPFSPCIVSQVPEDKVGAVSSFNQFQIGLPGKNKTLISRIADYLDWSFTNAHEYYSTARLPNLFDQVVQTGVMVLSPKHHKEVLEYTYYNYQDTPVGDFEMESLSYELIKSNSVHWLDDKFNQLWIACMLMNYPFLLPPKPTEVRLIRLWKRFTRGHYQLPPKTLAVPALNTAFMNNYFLHFAGFAQYMPWVNTKIQSWQEISLNIKNK